LTDDERRGYIGLLFVSTLFTGFPVIGVADMAGQSAKKSKKKAGGKKQADGKKQAQGKKQADGKKQAQGKKKAGAKKAGAKKDAA